MFLPAASAPDANRRATAIARPPGHRENTKTQVSEFGPPYRLVELHQAVVDWLELADDDGECGQRSGDAFEMGVRLNVPQRFKEAQRCFHLDVFRLVYLLL